MDRPLEVIFRNMQPSPELEALVQEHAARLEKLDNHIMGFRVTIELENHTHKTGNSPEVHIEIQVPGETLTINHNHTRDSDALISIHDAFRAATTQLKEYLARKAGRVKHHKLAQTPAAE
jgi:ribosome-associated translation inhibitor RaiA